MTFFIGEKAAANMTTTAMTKRDMKRDDGNVLIR